MSQLSTQNTGQKQSVRDWLMREDIQQGIGHALGGWMKPEEFLSQILIALSDPSLSKCSPTSKYQAAHTCAALQLLPTVNHVALIPRKVYKNKQCVGEVVTVMPQWQGLKSLMERHPDVLEVNAHLVHKNDMFNWHASTNMLEHNYDPFDENRTWDDELSGLRGAYLKIEYSSDSRLPKYHFITRKEIIKRRECAETRKVWDRWPKEQALKSAYRDGYQRRVVPIDPLASKPLSEAAKADDKAMGNDPSRVSTEAVITDVSRNIDPRSRADYLAGHMGISQFQQDPPPVIEESHGATPDNTVEPSVTPRDVTPSEGTTREKMEQELAGCETREQVSAMYEFYSQSGITGADKDWLFESTEKRYAEFPEDDNEYLEKIKAKIEGYKQVARIEQIYDETDADPSLNDSDRTQIKSWCESRIKTLQSAVVSKT